MAQQMVVWVAFCLVILVLAVRWPVAARLAVGVLVVAMAIGVNIVIPLAAPDRFVELGTGWPLLPLYGWVFEYVVAAAPIVFGLLVASYAVTVGLLMVRGGRWASLGLLGGAVLLIVTAPLAVWSAPNLILAAALVVVLVRGREPATGAASTTHAPPAAGASAAAADPANAAAARGARPAPAKGPRSASAPGLRPRAW